MTAAVALFAALVAALAALKHWYRPGCKHPGAFDGLPSSRLVECRACGEIVEFGDVQ